MSMASTPQDLTPESYFVTLPRQVEYFSGAAAAPPDGRVDAPVGAPQAVRDLATRLTRLWKTSSSGRPVTLELVDRGSLPDAGSFRVDTRDSAGIRLQALTAEGLEEASRLLHSLIVGGRPLVEFTVVDKPAFARRGVMLDITRCRVPTPGLLYDIIDLMAALRLNELQLYCEHTFAFRDHETVWQDASPLSADEVREIDVYCADRGIDLVPNLNSFGHFERWLRHPQYKHLAECPDGFFHPSLKENVDHGSVLTPGPQALAFIDGLYDELLPNFSSRYFNVGCDETWELGYGRSKPEIESRGRQAVYLDHLISILESAKRHGRTPQFWADIVLEDPATLDRLPDDCIPIVWGYSPTHPYEEQTAHMARIGCPFYVAPGTSTWNSFSGRYPHAIDNLKLATASGSSAKARGVLITNWGDNTHPQATASLFPPLAAGALLSWNPQASTAGVPQLLANLLSDTSPAFWQAVIDAGSMESIFGPDQRNRSWFHVLFYYPPAKKPEVFEAITRESLGAAWQRIAEIEQAIAAEPASNPYLPSLKLALTMNRMAIQRGQAHLGQKITETIRLEDVQKEYQKVWLLDSRPGGLQESIELMSKGL